MGQTILLIDDSAILRRIATNVLGTNPMRYEVVTATRATEGFARACGTHLGLILVDAQLAGSAKAELCQRFLDEPRTATVPMVLLLGRGAQASRLEDLPDNVVDTLSKPFTPEQLTSSVKAILSASKGDGNFAALRGRLCNERANERPILVDRKAVADAVQLQAAKPSRELSSLQSPVGSAGSEAIYKVKPQDASKAKRASSGVGSLRAALHEISVAKMSGVFSVLLPDRPALDVHFDAGSVVVVATRDADAYSKDVYGVLPSKVSPATLETAIDDQRGSGVPFFLTLGARGLLSKASAVDLVHRFGQKFFSAVWEHRPTQLRYVFTGMDALPGFALRLEPRRESVDEWLLDALRRLTPDDVALTAKHEGFVGTPALTRNGQSLLNFLELTPQEKEFARRVTDRIDLPGIAKAMEISTEVAYVLLYRFRALEIMDYRPAPAAYVVTPRTSVRRVLPLRH